MPGAEDKTQALKAEFNRKGDADLETIDDVYVIGSAFKLYLRELPVPPLTYRLYDAFAEALDEDNLGVQASLFANAVNALPPLHHALVRYVCYLLVDMAETGGASSLMGIDNMATVFGQNMLHSPTDTQADIMRDVSYCNDITRYLLAHYDELFEDSAPAGPHAHPMGAPKSAPESGADETDDSILLPGTPDDSHAAAAAASVLASPATNRELDSLIDDSISSALIFGPRPGANNDPLSPLSAHMYGPQNSPARRLDMVQEVRRKRSSGSGGRSSETGDEPKIPSTSPPVSEYVWTPKDIPYLEDQVSKLDLDISVFKQVFAKRFGRPPLPSEWGPIETTLALFQSFSNILATLRSGSVSSISSPVARFNSPTKSYFPPASPSSSSIPHHRPPHHSNSNEPATSSLASPDPPSEEPESDLDAYLANPLPAVRRRLAAAASAAGRPTDIEQMTPEQRDAEKSLIKKELRAFDSAFEVRHGHEPRKADKEVMRPLYEKYRLLKRRTKADPDAAAVVAPTAPAPTQPTPTQPTPVQPTPATTAAPAPAPAPAPHRPTTTALFDPAIPVTHDMLNPSIPKEANALYLAIKDRKRTLQVFLHHYQTEFMAKHGRKVQYVEDRAPIQTEYLAYKQCKSRLAEANAIYDNSS